MLLCNNFWLDAHRTLYLRLLNASLLPVYLLDPLQYPEGPYEIRSFCPSVLLSVRVFSCNLIIRFVWILAWCYKPLWSGAWQSQIFLKKIFLPQNLGKWVKHRVFWIQRKIWSLIFIEFDLQWKFILFTVFLHKFYIWKKSFSWDIEQSDLSQSVCRLFKSTNPPEEICETASFFACWFFFGQAWSKISVANLVSGLNLNVPQEWTDGINWFFACQYKFTQI